MFEKPEKPIDATLRGELKELVTAAGVALAVPNGIIVFRSNGSVFGAAAGAAVCVVDVATCEATLGAAPVAVVESVSVCLIEIN